MTILQIRQKIQAITLDELQRLVVIFSVTALSLLILYGYLVSTTIMHMVEYRNLTEESASLSTKLGALESEYMALNHGLTLEQAHELGYVDVIQPEFLAVGGPTRLTLARD